MLLWRDLALHAGHCDADVFCDPVTDTLGRIVPGLCIAWHACGRIHCRLDGSAQSLTASLPPAAWAHLTRC